MKEEILNFINEQEIHILGESELSTFEFIPLSPNCTICGEVITEGTVISSDISEEYISEEWEDANYILCEDCTLKVNETLQGLIEL